MHKLYLISAKGYKNAKVDFLTVITTSEIWVNMKDAWSGMGVKNMSDLVLKEIYGICEKKILQKDKLMNIKWQKEKFIKSLEMMSWLLLLNVAEVKKQEV